MWPGPDPLSEKTQSALTAPHPRFDHRQRMPPKDTAGIRPIVETDPYRPDCYEAARDPNIIGGQPDCCEAAQDPTIVGGCPPQGYGRDSTHRRNRPVPS